MSVDTDPKTLLQRYCDENDQAAFNRFYRGQSGRLWGFLRSRGCHEEAAYDLVAEAFGRTGGEEGGPGLRDRSAQAAMAKVAASEVALRAADEAVQIYGGYGYIRDYPVEKLLRDAKGTEIVEGANEILREIVARAVLDELPRG